MISRVDDEVAIRAMHSVIFPSDSWVSFDDHTAGWIARCEGKLAGFCVARKLKQEPYVFLERAGVFKKYSGLGLQRQMINVRVRWAKRIGARGCLTYAKHSNHQSIANLIRTGFRLYEPSYKWGDDALYFYKHF